MISSTSVQKLTSLQSSLVAGSLLPGNTTLFGGAGTGKTSLAESIVSLAMRGNEIRKGMFPGQIYAPRIVASALASWSSPATFEAMVSQSVWSLDSYNKTAKEILLAADISDPASLSELLSRHSSELTREFKSRLSHLMKYYLATGVDVSDWSSDREDSISDDELKLLQSYSSLLKPDTLILLGEGEDGEETEPDSFTLFLPLCNKRAINMSAYLIVKITNSGSDDQTVEMELTSSEIEFTNRSHEAKPISKDLAKYVFEIWDKELLEINAYFQPIVQNNSAVAPVREIPVKLSAKDQGLITTVLNDNGSEYRVVLTTIGVFIMQNFDSNNAKQNIELSEFGPGDGYVFDNNDFITIEDAKRLYGDGVVVNAREGGDEDKLFPIPTAKGFVPFVADEEGIYLGLIDPNSVRNDRTATLNGQAEGISAGLESASKQSELFYSWLVQNSASQAYQLLVDSKVLIEECSRSHDRSRTIGSVLHKAWANLQLKKGPCLILTEEKAKSKYSMIASNDSLESTMTQLQLNTHTGMIDSSVSCSLLTATIGSLLFADVIHISTLDLTMVGSMAVKSATQKGGLDSSVLNMLQFISNSATQTGKFVLTEMRDDFTKGENTTAGIEDARTTMGANSRVAIQIWSEGEGSNSRNIWMRFKGGEQMVDQTVSYYSVGMSQYPRNDLRKSEVLPTVTEFAANYLDLIN